MQERLCALWGRGRQHHGRVLVCARWHDGRRGSGPDGALVLGNGEGVPPLPLATNRAATGLRPRLGRTDRGGAA